MILSNSPYCQAVQGTIIYQESSCLFWNSWTIEDFTNRCKASSVRFCNLKETSQVDKSDVKIRHRFW